jgi:hypothetical protein
VKKKRLKKSIGTLHDDAWKLMSEYVRRKENGKCFTCGKVDDWKNCDAGHFIHRDCLDYEEMNIHCQCVRCNRYLHGNLGVYGIKMVKVYGIKQVELLYKLSHLPKKFKRIDLEAIISNLKEAINGLSGV